MKCKFEHRKDLFGLEYPEEVEIQCHLLGRLRSRPDRGKKQHSTLIEGTDIVFFFISVGPRFVYESQTIRAWKSELALFEEISQIGQLTGVRDWRESYGRFNTCRRSALETLFSAFFATRLRMWF